MSTQIPEPIANGVSQRELELIAKVKALEDDRVKFLEIVRGKIQKLEKELEVTIMGYGGMVIWYLLVILSISFKYVTA